ncbi:hypothetical protein AV530_009957 [Patagioenas fasciata monilis]|uniref:Uncharacterized protein n=1 Tax=Patagioenas fasciata monilis TaxID=372326 RepID=A0A1V4KCC3_PATFA|nr:hypothetical protein AV530_009957 [Patagioenas fasciata monilis]
MRITWGALRWGRVSRSLFSQAARLGGWLTPGVELVYLKNPSGMSDVFPGALQLSPSMKDYLESACFGFTSLQSSCVKMEVPIQSGFHKSRMKELFIPLQ